MRIVDVGNNIFQFKFSSQFQLEWVEKSGPWKRGLTSTKITFTHSPFWVQIWGLPFEHMSQEARKDIGNKIGRFIDVDKHS